MQLLQILQKLGENMNSTKGFGVRAWIEARFEGNMVALELFPLNEMKFQEFCDGWIRVMQIGEKTIEG